MSTAYIGLGSNMGDKLGNLNDALSNIKKLSDTTISLVSSVYQTAPEGYKDQDWFLNAVVRLETSLSAQSLLKELLNIENQMGRVRTIHWGPRVIDLDILLYNMNTINQPDLIIPHPRIMERAFVLVPLLEIEPQLEMPSGTKLLETLNKMDNCQEIFKISENLICK